MKIKIMLIVLVVMQLACMKSAISSTDFEADKRIETEATLPPTVRNERMRGGFVAPAAVEEVRLCGNANLRGGPAEIGPAYGVLYAGKFVRVLDRRGGWVQVARDPERWIIGKVVCR